MSARSLLVGGLLGIAATLGGLGLAKADCAHDAHELNVWRAEAICDEAVQGWLEDDQVPYASIEGHDGMWEACMRLATPVTVLPAAQHYDLTDGAFWKGGDK